MKDQLGNDISVGDKVLWSPASQSAGFHRMVVVGFGGARVQLRRADQNFEEATIKRYSWEKRVTSVMPQNLVVVTSLV